MVAWLLMPVLQECYHVILTNSLRRAWAAMDPVARPPNWLVMYKRQPELLKVGFPELAVCRRDSLLTNSIGGKLVRILE